MKGVIMKYFFEIENDELLLKKEYKGNLITLYLKIEGCDMNMLDENSIKKINHFTKQIPFINKKRINNE